MRISAGERFMALLGYLAFLFIIPVKVRRDSMFVQFHARQGGVLFVLWFLLAFILMIVALFAGSGLGVSIVIEILIILTILYAILAVIGILKVLLGERYRMPVVADIALMLRL